MTQPTWTTTRPTAIVASRLRELRSSLDLSAQKLADRCAEHGMPQLNRWLITNIETGRRESISVDELYVLARALDVSPIHLLTPYDDQEVFVTPVEQHPSERVHQWVAAQQPLDDDSLVLVAEPAGWNDLETFLETRYQRILWTAVERAKNKDGTVDADALERELSDILGEVR